MAAEILTQAALKELLDYDQDTGVFRWRVNRNGLIRAGSIAGGKSAVYKENGRVYYRLQIKISCKLHLAHRLAWLYVHGEWPESQIDHINGNPLDNRIANLRQATPKQNSENRRLNANNTSGYRGVNWYARGKKWCAHLQHANQQVHIGYFDCPHEAGAAVQAMREALFTHTNESRHPVADSSQ